jgi:hypothetical protein
MRRIIGVLAFMCISLFVQGQVKYRFNEYSSMIEPASLMKDANVIIDPAWLDNPEDKEDISRDITGYPFLVVGWALGSIETKTQTFSCDALNFFFIDQQLWYKEEGGVRMLTPIPPRDGYDPGTKAKFVNERSLYLGSESSPLQLLPEKLTDFLALFPDKAEEMKQFLAKNKIRNLRKEADVMKAIAYYNSL